METIPAGYLIFIYALIALPYVVAVLGVVALIVIAILYCTNRRKAAVKLLKIVGVTLVVLLVLAWMTRSSLGLGI
jgi:hypothetical protein